MRVPIIYALPLLALSSCSPSSSSTQQPLLEVRPEVTSASQITTGNIYAQQGYTSDDTHVAPSFSLNLNVPDGSEVLQFTNPQVDLKFYCSRSEHSVTSLPCQLTSAGGVRRFTLKHTITEQQYKTLAKIVITRIYEGPQ